MWKRFKKLISWEGYASFDDWLNNWKPIHLCWWFIKHHRPIPKYFIGGKTAPSVTTNPADPVSATWATGNGNVTSNGGDTSEWDQGFVFSSTDATPEIGEAGVTQISSGGDGTTGVYSDTLTPLSQTTTYYYQAYATNSKGTSYGGVESFETLDQSASPSLSPSVSPSASKSLSPSVSESLSPSSTPSPSGAAPIEGSTCWGHSTGVTETNTRTFADHWYGTGSIVGSGDSEEINLAPDQYLISEVVNTGTETVELDCNHYDTGDTPTLSYRTGATEADCLNTQTFTTYSEPFESLGYVQVRVDKP